MICSSQILEYYRESSVRYYLFCILKLFSIFKLKYFVLQIKYRENFSFVLLSRLEFGSIPKYTYAAQNSGECLRRRFVLFTSIAFDYRSFKLTKLLIVAKMFFAWNLSSDSTGVWRRKWVCTHSPSVSHCRMCIFTKLFQIQDNLTKERENASLNINFGTKSQSWELISSWREPSPQYSRIQTTCPLLSLYFWCNL